MKLLRFIVLVLFVGYLNVGCTSTESPEQLIERPVYDNVKESIYNNVKRVLDKGAVIILPRNSSEISSINYTDLDNDGVEELVVFQKLEDLNNNTSRVGFIVLNKSNGNRYSVKAEYMVEGNSIEYANFYDLDNNGTKEIILSTKTDSKTNLEILNLDQNKIISLNKYNPTWISNKSGYTDIKVKIGDLDNDNIKDMIILNYNPDTRNMAVSLTYFDKYIRLVDFKMITDVRSIDNVYLDIYKVHKDINGIVIDIKSFKEKDSYITQILYLKDKQLQKAFDDNLDKFKKPYYIQVEDINGDGIVEIPVVNNSAKGYRTKTSANISWYDWNGSPDTFRNLTFINQIYYNYKNNFKLLIPSELANKISIEEEYRGNIVSFNFYYYDNLRPQDEFQKIFTITKSTKSKIDESGKGGSTNTNAFILFENDTDIFTLNIDSQQLLDELNIDKEQIKENFLPIYTGQ